MARTWHGPYTVLGNPHVNDVSNTSFHSQISSVFKVPGKKDLYIACADRWLPDKMDLEYESYSQIFEMLFNPDAKKDMSRVPESMRDGQGDNTSVADYVWLPLRFEEPDAAHPYGMVYIDWTDEWRIEDYE